MATLGAFGALCLLHAPLFRLPYFWDEAGYYIPAAQDFYHHGLLIPQHTLPSGHTPLLSVYLGLAWHLFGFSPFVTRVALVLVAALTVVALYVLGRRVVQGEAKREIMLWSSLLLALSPVFFAQSSLAQPEILVALFTTRALIALLGDHLLTFALVASLAILSKETAVILLPVAWLFSSCRRREKRLIAWIALVLPTLPLLAWALYYHRATGFWTGNAEYLRYNLYSTLSPARIFLTLLRRIWELFLAGFNWVLLLASAVGLWLTKSGEKGKRAKGEREVYTEGGIRHTGRQKNRARMLYALYRIPLLLPSSPSAPRTPNPEPRVPSPESQTPNPEPRISQLTGDFIFLSTVLLIAYLLTLSLVGGAVLARYLVPVFPIFYLLAVTFTWRLPRAFARTACALAAACLVGSWFINPPYPFPFENNLSYADFIRLHQEAAHLLENLPGDPIVLTAWPASGELTTPALGYVSRPLRVKMVRGFTAEDFDSTTPQSFDLLYLYSRRWEPEKNWLARWALLRETQRRYFGYASQISELTLVERYHLRLLLSLERRGQWVRIYIVAYRKRESE